jgi:hypothetical protein
MSQEYIIPVKCACGNVISAKIINEKVADLTLKCPLCRIILEDPEFICQHCGNKIGIFIDIELASQEWIDKKTTK